MGAVGHGQNGLAGFVSPMEMLSFGVAPLVSCFMELRLSGQLNTLQLVASATTSPSVKRAEHTIPVIKRLNQPGPQNEYLTGALTFLNQT